MKFLLGVRRAGSSVLSRLKAAIAEVHKPFEPDDEFKPYFSDEPPPQSVVDAVEARRLTDAWRHVEEFGDQHTRDALADRIQALEAGDWTIVTSDELDELLGEL